MKPPPADEVLLAVAALTALSGAALKPAPDTVSEPAADVAAETAAIAATSDAATGDAANSDVDEAIDETPQQAALPPGQAPERADLAPDDGKAETAANVAQPNDAKPIYTWADPAVLIPIQHQLTARGFKIGTIDGILGPRTRDAIKRYQSQQGLPVDGKASAALLRHMTGRPAATAGSAPQDASNGSAPVDAASPPPALGAAGAAAAAATAEVDAAGLVRLIQQRLQRLGYLVDTPYGTMGSHTREAISTYQWRNGLKVDGQPSAKLLTHLEQQGGG